MCEGNPTAVSRNTGKNLQEQTGGSNAWMNPVPHGSFRNWSHWLGSSITRVIRLALVAASEWVAGLRAGENSQEVAGMICGSDHFDGDRGGKRHGSKIYPGVTFGE